MTLKAQNQALRQAVASQNGESAVDSLCPRGSTLKQQNAALADALPPAVVASVIGTREPIQRPAKASAHAPSKVAQVAPVTAAPAITKQPDPLPENASLPDQISFFRADSAWLAAQITEKGSRPSSAPPSATHVFTGGPSGKFRWTSGEEMKVRAWRGHRDALQSQFWKLTIPAAAPVAPRQPRADAATEARIAVLEQRLAAPNCTGSFRTATSFELKDLRKKRK